MLNLIEKYPKQADIILLVVGFSIGANFFMFLKLYGMEEYGLSLDYDALRFHWSNPTIAGLSIGLGISFLEFRVLGHLKLKNRILLLSIRFIIFSSLIVFCISLVQVISDLIFYNVTFPEALQDAHRFVGSDMFISLYIYLMILGISLNFIRSIGTRFGHGILVNYLAGKYAEPVEENRVFMFVDLNGSTRLAEKLGHVKYSRFINKCFHDLSEVLPKYGGEIYQYVGDEAVITWRWEKLKDPLKPFLLFNSFESELKKNEQEYLEKFSAFPTFKASVNAGVVTVSEVGGKRKELAYHGDVLNTCSRLLELCKKYQHKLLTTAVFLGNENSLVGITTQYLTTIQLRGKSEKVSVYGIV